jgi:hypothetical protein
MLLRELLKNRGIAFIDTSHRDKHVRAGWLQMHCPFCGVDKWHLGYNESQHYFNCYSCGWHSVYAVLHALFPRDNIKQMLSEIGVVRFVEAEDTDTVKRLVLPSNVGELLLAHREYLVGRGLDPDELEAVYGVGGIGIDPVNSYLQWRIFIPIHDARGQVVSWTTRAIGSNKPAYFSADKSSELESLKMLLYGEHLVTHFDTVFIVEGVFDAWRLGRNALATFGKTLTVSQKNKISKYAKRIICFDNEPDTQNQAKHLCNELRLFPGKTINVCLDAPDPAEASDIEIRRLYSLFV